MIKEVRNQENGYRDYGYDDPLKQEPQINDRNIQVTLIVELPTPIISHTSHVDQQNVYFKNESLQSISVTN